jgi:hypothetical protein
MIKKKMEKDHFLIKLLTNYCDIHNWWIEKEYTRHPGQKRNNVFGKRSIVRKLLQNQEFL